MTKTIDQYSSPYNKNEYARPYGDNCPPYLNGLTTVELRGDNNVLLMRVVRGIVKAVYSMGDDETAKAYSLTTPQNLKRLWDSPQLMASCVYNYNNGGRMSSVGDDWHHPLSVIEVAK